jgi:hypothetical protein
MSFEDFLNEIVFTIDEAATEQAEKVAELEGMRVYSLTTNSDTFFPQDGSISMPTEGWLLFTDGYYGDAPGAKKVALRWDAVEAITYVARDEEKADAAEVGVLRAA